MQIVNTKSMFSYICRTLDDIDHQRISLNEATVKSNLIKQAVSVLNYELKRAVTEQLLSDTATSIRQVESKGFDDTTNTKMIEN